MENLYNHTEEIHNTKSAKEVIPILLNYIKPNSVLDIGCGLGTWLKVFRDTGVIEVFGVDGDYLDRSKLTIPEKYFQELDLRKPFALGRKFDLALCLEVAEHLPESSADALVASLCQHADTILFSSAIPGQGGQNHINEQWPEYWRERFSTYGFVQYDIIRPQVWTNQNVDIWYRQNIFVFSKANLSSTEISSELIASIHPQLWNQKIEAIERLNKQLSQFEKGGAGIKRSCKALANALFNKLR